MVEGFLYGNQIFFIYGCRGRYTKQAHEDCFGEFVLVANDYNIDLSLENCFILK